MVINSEENKLANLQKLAVHDDYKENVQNNCKLTKLETDVKNYETLVTELNKLSAEEQNMRNKLFTHNWKVSFDFACTYIIYIKIVYMLEYLGSS